MAGVHRDGFQVQFRREEERSRQGREVQRDWVRSQGCQIREREEQSGLWPQLRDEALTRRRRLVRTPGTEVWI